MTQGQVLTGSGCTANGNCLPHGNGDRKVYESLVSGASTFTLKLRMKVRDKEWVPRVEWVESCPFNKADGVLTGTECSEPGGTKTGVMEGKPGTSHRHAGHTGINMSLSPQITAPVRNMSIIRPVRWPHVSARFIPMREPVCMSTPRTPASPEHQEK